MSKETKDDEARHTRQAKWPWPNKSELSKRTVAQIDTEGRKYYKLELKLDSEFRFDFVKNFMTEFYKKEPQGYWIALPPKTSLLGGMPEQSTVVQFKSGIKMKVLGCTEIVERKQRGTGFIVLAF